jgi:hypothetical protein
MKRTILTICILTCPLAAIANMVWPALYAETKVSTIPIILLSLVFEYFGIRWIFKQSATKSILYCLAANLTSGLIGLILRPLSGIVWELTLGNLVMWIFNWGTFNPVSWFFVPVIGGAINASLELLTIKLLWKEKYTRKSFILMWFINIITVGLATVWVILYPPQL